ncbi:MAG: metallophosphoesterase family protein [Candidatus Aminicenantes bacterium]|nr:metallophosphoesterase family protein [Candidatus Aminicenantes bacterium]
MRYLIFTDIHGNMEAFQSVLKAVRKKKIDHYIFLGDLVGYGASPNEVIQKILTLKPLSIIRGNHDKAVSGLDSVQTFNPIAAAAIFWTKNTITRKNLDFLVRLKQGPEIVQDAITICHGAPFDEDYYIFGEFDAAEAFSYIQTPICFFGHTHFPFVYTEKDGSVEGTFLEGDANEVKLEKGTRYLINPGSVGQPRDRNARAAYAVYDSEARTIKFGRVDYDIEEAKRRIIDEKLPPALAERLSLGI